MAMSSSSSTYTSNDDSEDDNNSIFPPHSRRRDDPSDPLSFRQVFRATSSLRNFKTMPDEAAAAVDQEEGEDAPFEHWDSDALIIALDECEHELEECKKNLKKAKRKNKEILEDFAEQRRNLSDLEENYALIKLELAEARSTDDEMLVATQQALADRDVMLLELTQERDQVVAELKRTSKERNDLAKKTIVLEECLADKDLRLLNVVAENDALKEQLKKARIELDAAHYQVELLDMLNNTEAYRRPSPPPVKITVTNKNRWGRGFRNPLRRKSTPKQMEDHHQQQQQHDFAKPWDESTLPSSEEDFFQ